MVGDAVPNWVPDVIDFLEEQLPRDEFGDWEHWSSSAFQMGCEAMVALGQADETERGVVPRQNRRLPMVLPRLDDVSVVILGLARQRYLFEYRLANGEPQARGLSIRVNNVPPSPKPNVLAAHGLGFAYAQPKIMPLLANLGLVAQGRWTAKAPMVLWREQPAEWSLDVDSDPRFLAATQRALASMPSEIRIEIARLVVVTEQDVEALLVLYESSNVKAREKYGANAFIRADTPDQARKTVEFQRRNELDWLFFRRWRFDDGWLTPSHTKRALAIFHDPLASAMRRAVTMNMYPDLTFLDDRPPSTIEAAPPT
jgi:hypothetical protein